MKAGLELGADWAREWMDAAVIARRAASSARCFFTKENPFKVARVRGPIAAHNPNIIALGSGVSQ